MNVNKVRCLVEHADSDIDHMDAEVVFISGIPHAIFEWDPDATEIAQLVHLERLDPKRLQPVLGWGEVTHFYEIPVKDPRPASRIAA